MHIFTAKREESFSIIEGENTNILQQRLEIVLKSLTTMLESGQNPRSGVPRAFRRRRKIA